MLNLAIVTQLKSYVEILRGVWSVECQQILSAVRTAITLKVN